MLSVMFFVIRKAKRSACHYDKCFFFAMEAAGEDTTQAAVKLKQWREREADFLRQTDRRRDSSRSQIGTFGRSEAGKATWQAQEYYNVWSKSIGVKESIKTLAKYYDVKYNDSPRYELLQGYTRAVRKGDISPLVGFARYEEVAGEVKQMLVGVQTATGVTIEDFTSHFVDRIIGQTSTSHSGMRKGVPIEDALYTLTHPSKPVKERTCADGDIRQTLQSEKCAVTYSVRDRKLIQTNP